MYFTTYYHKIKFKLIKARNVIGKQLQFKKNGIILNNTSDKLMNHKIEFISNLMKNAKFTYKYIWDCFFYCLRTKNDKFGGYCWRGMEGIWESLGEVFGGVAGVLGDMLGRCRSHGLEGKTR